VCPKRTQMLTHDKQPIWEVQAGEHVTCRSCGRKLEAGEMVTKGLIAVSAHALVCKYCRPFDLFYVPEPPGTQRLASTAVGAHYHLSCERHHDGSLCMRLRNACGGWYEVVIDPEEAGDLAVALASMAAGLLEVPA